MIVLVTSIIAVAFAAVCWILSMRPIDRISLVIRFATKLGLHNILSKPELYQATISNGYRVLLPGRLASYVLEEALNFKMRPDDVIVSTYTKSGTTWMQEIVWLICNDADIKTAKATGLLDRYGFLEVPHAMSAFGKGFQALERWPTDKRRFIKTHLPFQLLPYELQAHGRGKMICVVRNPKDNCVSFYHFHRMNKVLPDPGSWSDFLSKFCSGELMLGSWFDYVHEYWQVYQKRKDSMYFVSYESLKRDLKKEIEKLAKFLERDLTHEQIDAIAKHCSFSSMSQNQATNYSSVARSGVMNFQTAKFMRKGEVGDWKNHFTINQNDEFDRMYRERTKDWTLEFEFELGND